MSATIRTAKRHGPLTGLDSGIQMSVMARELYGDRLHDDSSLTAFAYLYRRFGPPPRGGDDLKEIAVWLLKTRDPQVYLGIYPGGCSIDLYLSHYVDASLAREAEAPMREYRRQARAIYDRIYPDGDYEGFVLEGIGESRPCWEGELERLETRTDPEILTRVDAVLRHILLDLLRPVVIRDVEINLFGRCNADNPPRGRSAPWSHLAGWGVPIKAMEAYIAESRRSDR